MKKRLFMFATAALMLTACSNDSDVVVPGGASLQSGPGVVAFDTYTSSATKSGDAGIQTTSTLQAVDKGFGVFAQYSDNTGYSNATNPVANFMYNQQVKYASGAWTYSPLKYWPNETETDPQATGISAATDKLSFFAYAPYVSGALSGTGIDGMIANNAKDIDPWVSYSVATTPSESVDLLWGVAPSGGLKYTDVAGTAVDIPEGTPLINLTKPAKDQKIKFLFQHALARLGLTIVAAFDQIAPGGNQGAGTKIAVKSVVITETTSPTKQLKASGKLLLKNGTAWKSSWNGVSGDISFTIDGANLNPAIKWSTGDAETYLDDDVPGVTTTEQKVIAQTGAPAHDNYFMVIPSHANTELQVVITYRVITADASLASGYAVVENVITKKVTINELTNNKAYNLKLILGMTSVKLDAEVADWKVDGSTEVYLPQNKE